MAEIDHVADAKERDRTDAGSRGALTLSRRGVLGHAAAIAAAAALPRTGTAAAAPMGVPKGPSVRGQMAPIPRAGPETAADYPVSEVMERLSTYISEARARPLPSHVVERAKLAVLDTVAAMIAGSQLPPGIAAINFARAYGGRPVSTIAADTALCGPIEAALVNGVLADADETGDVVAGPWHPGCNVIPAALALGEQFSIGGAHFLRAVAVGYDIGTRVMFATGVRMNFESPTNSMGGNFGATAAAACAGSLSAQQVRWALAYAAQQCSGLDDFQRDPEHIEKAFLDGGMGARNGATAALLVLSGFNGVNDIFSGPVSFFTRYGATADPEKLAAELGERYYVAQNFYKEWPVGAPLEAPLEALLAVLKREPLDPHDVREIVIRYSEPGGITDNGGSPDVNIQHAIALMLIDRKLTFKSIHDRTRLKDPEVIAVRSIVRLIPLPFGVDIPAAQRNPILEIVLKNGRHIRENAKAAGVPGSSSYRDTFSREWVAGKAHSLMTPVLGAGRTRELVERVLKLEEASSVRELRPLLQLHQLAGPPRLSEWPMG